jgi:NADPH:quinone reductase-like Zn-dependent oxidoreductase
MKAIVQHRYGGPEVLQYRDVPTPAMGDDDILVRVKAASLNPRDWHLLRGIPYFVRLVWSGLRQPKFPVIGSDIAGEVEAVGKNVTRFRPGDTVFADVATGGFAEYVAVPEALACAMPKNTSFEEAASLPLAALTALQGLRDVARLQPGQHVLIIGAGGGIGTYAVQMAKAAGAYVTGVCSTSKRDLVCSLGADDVIDYTREDFTRARSGRRFDVIFQYAGTASPLACRRALTPKGMLVLSSGESSGRWLGPMDRILGAAVVSPLVSQRLTPFEAKRSLADLQHVKALVESGSLRTVIDRTYPLRETPEAIRYLEEGHARGKIVITV